MRIVTNEKLASRNRKIANYLFIATFVVLIGGFFFVNANLFVPTGQRVDTATLLLQTLVLPVAFIMTLISIRMTNNWARPPRPEDVFPEAFKGLSKKSVMFNYYHFPARHILFSPQGIFVLITRWHDGKYTIENDVWFTHANPITKFFSRLRMDGIGDPHKDALKATEHAQKLLDEHAPGHVVKPIIVMISSKAEVELKESTIPVVFVDSKKKPNLKDYLRDLYAQKEGAEGKKNNLTISDAQLAAFESATVPQDK
jgi:hypothetical protein